MNEFEAGIADTSARDQAERSFANTMGFPGSVASVTIMGMRVRRTASTKIPPCCRILSIWRLSRFLRGQRGTEQEIVEHPAGSRFVLLDPARQPRPTFSVSRIGMPIAWRTAPIPQGPTGDLSNEFLFTNTGSGLRLFSPVQLRAVRDGATGDLRLSWIRRSRLGGDSWVAEVPLGEEIEDYAVTILNGMTAVRTIRVGAPESLYTGAQQIADFGAAPASLTWTVAQVSRVYGAGVPATITSTL